MYLTSVRFPACGSAEATGSGRLSSRGWEQGEASSPLRGLPVFLRQRQVFAIRGCLEVSSHTVDFLVFHNADARRGRQMLVSPSERPLACETGPGQRP